MTQGRAVTLTKFTRGTITIEPAEGNMPARIIVPYTRTDDLGELRASGTAVLWLGQPPDASLLAAEDRFVLPPTAVTVVQNILDAIDTRLAKLIQPKPVATRAPKPKSTTKKKAPPVLKSEPQPEAPPQPAKGSKE